MKSEWLGGLGHQSRLTETLRIPVLSSRSRIWEFWGCLRVSELSLSLSDLVDAAVCNTPKPCELPTTFLAHQRGCNSRGKAVIDY